MFKYVSMFAALSQAVLLHKDRASIVHKDIKPTAMQVMCDIANERDDIMGWYEQMIASQKNQAGLNQRTFQISMAESLAEHDQKWTLEMGEDFAKSWNQVGMKELDEGQFVLFISETCPQK